MEWKPIETVPMDGTPVLLFLDNPPRQHSRIHVGWFLPNVPCGVIAGLFGYNMPKPLYWMSLPEEPK